MNTAKSIETKCLDCKKTISAYYFDRWTKWEELTWEIREKKDLKKHSCKGNK